MFSLSVPESWTRVSLKRRHPQSAEAAGAEELGQIWHTSQPMLTLTHIIVPQSREEKSHLWMHHSVSPFWQKKKNVWSAINSWTGGCYPKRSSCSACLWDVTLKKCCCDSCQKRLSESPGNDGIRFSFVGLEISLCGPLSKALTKWAQLTVWIINCFYIKHLWVIN